MRSLFYCCLALLLLSWCAAKEGVIQCANLIYGGTHTSRCFSDAFLSELQLKSTIPTARHFKSVKLGTDEIFDYPFVMMTGEADFRLTPQERTNLQLYLQRGGFLLASAGCSSSVWDQAFRKEIVGLFADKPLQKIPNSHPIFATVYKIEKLKCSDPNPYLEGIEFNGKLTLIYSKHGLNNSKNASGCCCCGGDEITNAMEMNINILIYALLH